MHPAHVSHQDERLGAAPIPYGPYAVEEALALASRMVRAGRAMLAARWGERLEPKGATR